MWGLGPSGIVGAISYGPIAFRSPAGPNKQLMDDVTRPPSWSALP